MNARGRNWKVQQTVAAGLLVVALAACQRGGGGPAVGELMKARNLSEADVTAALKTYTPTGVHDPYIMFASGGHAGHLLVIGIPSMRILKYIGVFTPEPWQGYGFDNDTRKMLVDGSPPGHPLTWGDVHHPALSETNGDYDGQFVFTNDKANGRVAVISLKDFETVQIVRSGLLADDHGGTFVTPDSRYVIETGQYPTPLNRSYADLDKFNNAYRGAIIFWRFDRTKGRIDKTQSFAIELPPYMQDIADAGKLTSDGWVFVNSFDTERSHGGIQEGNPPLESGASQNDMDYLHIINLNKAEGVANAAGKTVTIQGMRVIPLATAVSEGLLYFVPEPKSPHGVDVTPDGTQFVVSGKLDTHATVYGFAKVKALIDAGKFAGKDDYGVPILPFKESIDGQVEMGLGPLHTQFDGQGHGYTSLFIESKIARWSLKTLQVEEKIPVHYNIGHLSIAGGDTEHPDGHYMVAMNKWAIDRFADVGPLLPQNFQLIDISGSPMQLLYDMPIPLGEPHYAQIIRADKIKAMQFYTPVGTNPMTKAIDPNATTDEKQARVVRNGKVVDAYVTLVRSHINPDVIRVKQGDTVNFHVTSLEQTLDATHGFAIADYNVNLSVEPGETSNVTIVADQSGAFPFYCTEFCSALHLEMSGYLLVEPK